MSLDIDRINQQLLIFAKEVRVAFDNKDYLLAKDILLSKVLKLAPNVPLALSDLAFAESKLGNHLTAYNHLMKAIQVSGTCVNSAIYDELVSVTQKLHRYEESRYYAKLSLKVKKEEVSKEKVTIFPIPSMAPPGLSHDKSKNLICYSLFGQLPRYCETAVINSRIALQIYPEWTCRFYVDDSVPKNIIQRLEANGAQIVYVTEEQKKISGLFWRFFVFDDKDIQCFIIRDADSLLSYKEKAAVDEWLSSGKWFHIMRDAYEHSELILAGMWGGYTGILKNMEELITKHFSNLPILNKTIDQVFLRQIIWPTVSQSVIVHDNYMLEPNSFCYPDYPISEIEKIPYFHIGMIDSGIKTTKFYLDKAYIGYVRWFLKDEHGNEVCSYISLSKLYLNDYIVEVNLPYHYSLKVAENQWQISYHLIDKN
ncbi:hypothetical protein [uncultured Actinobacillus sp.]|uniref:tetratricopeptide repeat protein n=1 Tax=uncultured Actinobacillus sp. TaxID=417616 RepID=UPI0025D6D27A|nr:hypothetical protein [uncultured Actinobacillus sp.]